MTTNQVHHVRLEDRKILKLIQRLSRTAGEAAQGTVRLYLAS
jgi:hypothetical protein